VDSQDPERDIAVMDYIVGPSITRPCISERDYQWISHFRDPRRWRVVECHGVHAQVFRRNQISPVDGHSGSIFPTTRSDSTVSRIGNEQDR
jgi:hypothetical protein